MSVKIDPQVYLDAQEKAMKHYIAAGDAKQLRALSRRVLMWFNEQQQRGVVLTPEQSYIAGVITAKCSIEANKLADYEDILSTLKEKK